MFKDNNAEKKMFILVKKACFVNRRCDKMWAVKKAHSIETMDVSPDLRKVGLSARKSLAPQAQSRRQADLTWK